MANVFFNMLVKIILLISILSNIVNINGFPFERKYLRWLPFAENFNARRCMSTTRLDGKTVIVTGSNSGIGKATALEFYKRGANVIMACKDQTKAKAAMESIIKTVKEKYTDKMKNSLPNTGINVGTLKIYLLDLSNLKSVRDCANAILSNDERIDILVNNAGVFMQDKTFSVDGYELHLAVNHLGHFLFTLLLLKRIKTFAPSRIINVTSESYAWGDRDMHLDDMDLDNVEYSPIAAYGRSKLANILFTKELAKRLDKNLVTVYAVYPGITSTQIFRNMDSCYRLPYNFYIKYAKKTPKMAAQTILHCALDSKCAKETGLFYGNCKERKDLRPEATNPTTSRDLWNISLRLVKLTKNEYPFDFNNDTNYLTYVDDPSSSTGDTGILDNSTFDDGLTVPLLR